MDNTPENVFSDEKIMQKTGLKRPVAVQFFYNLTGDGELPDQGTMTGNNYIINPLRGDIAYTCNYCDRRNWQR